MPATGARLRRGRRPQRLPPPRRRQGRSLSAPVCVVLDPDDTESCQRAVTRLAGLEEGRVVCHPTPGGGGRRSLATDLLVAMGKDHDALAQEHLVPAAWPLVRTWLLGEGATDLFVLRAHLLAAARWEDLVSRRTGTGMRLWLVVHRGAPTPAQRRALGRTRWTSLTASEFAGRWSAAPVLPPGKGASAPLPAEGFLLFRAMCRWNLSPEEFERTDRTFTAAKAKTLAWLQGWPEGTPLSRPAVHAFLQRLTADSPDAADSLVRFRGAQAQLFRQGWLLWARAQEGSLFDPTLGVTRADTRVGTRLRTIAAPRCAALALVLLLSEAPPSAALEMRLRDVRAGEIAVNGERYAVPSWAEGLLGALVGERRRAGARPRDPLFLGRRSGVPLTVGEAGAILDHVERRTGLTIRPPSRFSYWEPPSRWLSVGALGLVEIGTPPERRSAWLRFD